MRYLLFFVLAGWCVTSQAQDLKAYQLYTAEGESTTYGDLLEAASEADVVLFGELHNNALVHWLQRQLTEDLAAADRPLALGAEMLEADNQLLLDEYLAGTIRAQDFEKGAKLWPNYDTDYAPMVNLAAEQGLVVAATNVPRRYAALVSREGMGGLDSLSAVAKEYCAPLPIAIDYSLPGYVAMEEMMGAHGGGGGARRFVQAQALKDATMAHFILAYRPEGGIMLHYNGTYHSKDFEGMVHYLQAYQPNLRVLTIHSIEQPDVASLAEEHQQAASFILVVPNNMAKTY